MDKSTKRKIFLTLLISILLSVLLFISSLTQNAYFIKDGEESVGSFGLIAFLLGFFGLSSGAGISWLANPCFFISFLQLKKENFKKAKIFSFISVLFGLSFMFFDEIIANEGGGKAKITGYDLGYWLWLSSLIIYFLGLLFVDIILKPETKNNL